MENKKYLTEESYQKTNKKVKTIGNVLIIIGLILLLGGFIFIVLGFFGFGNQASNLIETEEVNMGGMFSSIGGFALGGFMIPPALFITGLGVIIRFIIANRREITVYTTQQVMPVAKEGFEEIAPTIGKTTGEIAKSIAAGIKEGLNDDKK